MSYRKDMRSWLQYLEIHGMLQRVVEEVDRDWEIAAFCREYFVNYPKHNRKALLFERVRGFDMPVAIGVIGGSKSIYAALLGIPEENMTENVAKKWAAAINNRISTTLVKEGPVKENIVLGPNIDLFNFPHVMWTREHDPGYFLTAPCVISRHPKTGERNVGCYRCQIKGKDYSGISMAGKFRHICDHIDATNELNEPLPIAIVIGADPTIPLVAVSSVPKGVDELEVAGSIKGEPIEMVKCETIDLEVPATAEIVIEAEIPPNYTEEEGPFGEYVGYMGPSGMAPIFKVKAITHRNKPIYHAYFSQMPPSESSLLRAYGRESNIYAHLKDTLQLPVCDVHLTEAGGAAAYIIISVEKLYPGQFWQLIWGAWSFDPSLGKFTVVVDKDIDIRDPFAVEWAKSYRVRPNTDVYIIDNTVPVATDTALAPPGLPQDHPKLSISSKLVIDATKKWEYPPVALPPRDDLKKIRRLWSKYGLK